MKIFLKNEVIKKLLIVFIAIIMVSNFIVPNYAYAANKEGSKLVNGFFYLLAWFGDAALSLMQKTMMGTGEIEEYHQYAIKYSPGIIFSNVVPALDIDFIGASEENNGTIERYFTDVNSEDDIVKLIEKSNINKDNFTFIGNMVDMEDKGEQYGVQWYHHDAVGEGDRSYNQLIFLDAEKHGYWTYWGKWGDLTQNKVGKILTADVGWLDDIYLYIYGTNIYKVEILNDKTFNMYYCPTSNLSQDKEVINLESTAYKLKDHISGWYLALRTVALVGLLSVLVYIGIRIILSSTSAQDKAKYKNMLKDWLVAICIIFVLHYVMAFMLNFTGELNNIIKNNVTSISQNGNTTDDLMNNIREKVGDIDKNTTSEMAGYTVMYLALVILTGVFTVQYLKRVIFMAFLTMIAPMIALTYPLDKIKDSKAQAFSYWLKEYIFNCLIQPVHLLLYTIFVTNAIDFATDSNPNFLYAIVALAFLVPAEKFVKDMFGMKSNSPTGQLGAAAGGAMVMSMINKMKGVKPPKDGAGSPSAGQSGVRTVNSDNSGNPLSAKGGGSPPPTKGGGNPPPQSSSGINGASRFGRGNIIRGVNKASSIAGRAVRKLGGAGLGAAAGTVGLATQIADGDLFNDPSKAFTDTAVATGIGYVAGQNLVGAGANRVSNINEKLKEKMYGTDEYNNMKFDRKIYQSDEYKALKNDPQVIAACKAAKVPVRNAVQSFLNEGVTDMAKVKEALQNNIGAETYSSYSREGVDSPKAMREFAKNGVDAEKIKTIKLATGETDEKKLQRYNTIASEAKSSGITNPTDFITWARTKYGADEEDAKKLFKYVQHFI